MYYNDRLTEMNSELSFMARCFHRNKKITATWIKWLLKEKYILEKNKHPSKLQRILSPSDLTVYNYLCLTKDAFLSLCSSHYSRTLNIFYLQDGIFKLYHSMTFVESILKVTEAWLEPEITNIISLIHWIRFKLWTYRVRPSQYYIFWIYYY